MHGFGGMGFGMGWGWIIGLILLGVIIWLAARTTSRGNNLNSPGNKSAFDILKDRYARGEINKDEFEEKKRSIY
jgi:putative membrane protein